MASNEEPSLFDGLVLCVPLLGLSDKMKPNFVFRGLLRYVQSRRNAQQALFTATAACSRDASQGCLYLLQRITLICRLHLLIPVFYSRFNARPVCRCFREFNRDEMLEMYEQDQLMYKGGVRLKTAYHLVKVSAWVVVQLFNHAVSVSLSQVAQHLRGHFKKVKHPFIILQGTGDDVVDHKLAEALIDESPSKDKTLIYYEVGCALTVLRPLYYLLCWRSQ